MRLMGLAEVHQYTGIHVSTLRNWVVRGSDPEIDMPKPIAILSCGRIWNAEEIEKWWDSHRGRRRPY